MRTELSAIQSLYEYNSQRRADYLAAIWRLPPKERYRDRGASFPSLVDIYMHVLDAYKWWFDCVYSDLGEIEEYPLGRRYTRTEALRESRAVSGRVRNVVKTLRPADLARRYTIPGGRGRIQLRTLLLHMIEEELQHRGEMNALLWQAGRDPPVRGYDDQ